MVNFDVVVVGAGIAGLTLANEIMNKGLTVLVVEKARGSGGRLSAKSINVDSAHPELGKVTFDLGCSAIAPQSKDFKEFIIRHGAVHWDDQYFVGAPRNSAITRSLLTGIEARFQFRVDAITQKEGAWCIAGEEVGTGNRDMITARQVVLATPPQQALDLLPEHHSHKASLQNMSAGSLMLPQWVCLLVLKHQLKYSAQLMEKMNTSTLDKRLEAVIIESSKPDRAQHTTVQLQASPSWTQSVLEADKGDIAKEMIEALTMTLGEPVEVLNHYVHRWLYSYVDGELTTLNDSRNYLKGEDGLHLCGDYFVAKDKQGGAESAFHSAQTLSRLLT